MKITVEEQLEHILVFVEGTISLENLSPFDEKIQTLIKLNKHLIFDLKDVIYIDSSSIGILIMYHSKLKKIEKKLVLTEISKETNEIFQITGLNSKLLITKDLEETFKIL